MELTEAQLTNAIDDSARTGKAAEARLMTNERVLARITDGIYRQPASALRELISNAYDADATTVVVLTDAPRFSAITVRDNGAGLSPATLAHLVKNIGGSAKRTHEGQDLDITSKSDPFRSPSGRVLIGKLGIGLFAVAQFTRHFFIITKTKDDKFRTIADITLGPVNDDARLVDHDHRRNPEIETGHAQIYREAVVAEDYGSHGTEIKLVELLPRTRAELASEDLWAKIDYEKATEGQSITPAPRFHIGRIDKHKREELAAVPVLPWDDSDRPREKFANFVGKVRELADVNSDLVDLESVCDRYLQTLWTLALAAPLQYIDGHPFDMKDSDGALLFTLGNAQNDQAKQVSFPDGSTTLRRQLHLKSPDTKPTDTFDVEIDGVQLSRPIVFRDQPQTSTAVKTPLLFVGRCREEFNGKPAQLTGGPLDFEAYLFWTPKVIPTQHQGILMRFGNASGTGFDKTFMGYQVSEQTRLRQITAEIFVREGIDGAINIDRESYNFAHPHYQYITKWLYSALRQLTNKHKDIGKTVRTARLETAGRSSRAALDRKITTILNDRGIEDLPEVVILTPDEERTATRLRREGKLVLRRERIVPSSPAQRATAAERERQTMIERKISAIAQILESWGVLDRLSHSDQESLLREIAEVLVFEAGESE